jgi:DNA (cytosine-5)-methyltransferase 1
MNAVELFAGAGGMALGAERAGFKHGALVEFNAHACETLRLNRPEWPVLGTDVRDMDFAEYAGIDLLTAGAPCQPFSTAGKRRLAKDPRNMFPQVLRAIRTARPRALLLENVSGIRKGEALHDFDSIVGRIQQFGYDVEWRLINCADYGVPQRREPVFIVGFRRDLGVRWAWPEATHGEPGLLHAQWSAGSYWREHRPNEPARAIRRRSSASSRPGMSLLSHQRKDDTPLVSSGFQERIPPDASLVHGRPTA